MFIALLFSTIGVAAAAPADAGEQVAPLLDLLGLRALLEQTPAVLATAIESETQIHQEVPAASTWRRELDAQLKPTLLLQAVTRYLRDHYRADVFQQAQQRLQEPLAKRARYFDLAMTQPGVEKNLRDFLQQNSASANKDPQHQSERGDSATDAQVSAARRTVLQEIDAATASSLLMATLQSAIAARVQQATGNGVVDAATLDAEIAERQRYLAPLAVDYLCYEYRYLRDDELRDYRDLLRDEAVQALLAIGRQAVLTAIAGDAIAGEIRPPPSPRQSP